MPPKKSSLTLPSALSRRFFPFFVVQFLGALNDNLFRNAIFVLVTFHLADRPGVNAPMIVSMGAGLFIFPFFIFSAAAGTLADKVDRTRLVRHLKLIEFILILGGGYSLLSEQVSLMLVVLFLLGIQAAFFGPIKYSILPHLVDSTELVTANAYIEGGTFLAILAGTILGSIIITLNQGTWIVASAMAVLSLGGWLVSCAIPNAGKGDAPTPPIRRSFFATRAIMRSAMASSSSRYSILGISWFWFVGAVFLSMLPNYVKDILHGAPGLVTFLLTLFSVGIAIGSLTCSRLLRGQTNTRYVSISCFAMSLAIFVLCGASLLFTTQDTSLSVKDFIIQPAGILISFALTSIAVAGGIFTLPLYTLLQIKGDGTHRARLIAANNIFNSLFMVVASLFTMAILAVKFDVITIFLITGFLSILSSIFMRGIRRVI